MVCSRIEATADVICAVLANQSRAADVVDGSLVNQPSRAVPSATAQGADSVMIQMAYDTTYVGGSDCDTEWLTCNVTTSSPSCVALYAKLSGPAVLCSNDPQYLTVSASTSSLDIAYTVSVVVVTGREEGREGGREVGR